ncbi:AraC family transcriptional regulator [Mycolicibacterium sp. 120266]|uniref:AraC family transcriptional regulator n=1 Tax=Mycolicibacterium sp. 120266 TaxID=3090601 RepID=UPI00299E2AF7|nr:AraC family transcriptional regulator [Mycolicibacterium sp. 120266]MDX1875475.1 AraC family transcriptional regulator [Mycolicibacterium sp. 120266]
MVDLIFASSLSHVDSLIREAGGNPETLLARAGIDPGVVGASDRYIPISALSRTLGLCARELAIPDFALRLAQHQDLDILGPVAIVARNAETIGAAIRAVTEYVQVYSPAVSGDLRTDTAEASCRIDIVLDPLPYRAHVVELALGVTLTLFKTLDGPGFRPLRVTFQHSQISETNVYTDYFGCPVAFGAEHNALVLPRGLLQRRLPQIDQLAYDIAIRYMADRGAQLPFDRAVSALIVRSLPARAATLENIAELLMLHPRTLQRRLSESDRTFEDLVDTTRRDLALDLLANRNLPFSAVARQLGYSEQSALTRSCRRWFSVTPSTKRRELQ